MWQVKIKSNRCPFKDGENINNCCINEDNPTKWRITKGICEKEFCPIKAGD